jgi:hypothetical protein
MNAEEAKALLEVGYTDEAVFLPPSVRSYQDSDRRN